MTAFRLAPEWSRQEAVMLIWPGKHSDWAHTDDPHLLNKVEKTYFELTRYLSRQQPLWLIVHNDKQRQHVETMMAKQSITNVRFIKIGTDDTWIRDFGPVMLQSTHSDKSSNYKLLDFDFDGWGKKYRYQQDNAFNRQLATILEIEPFYEKIHFTLEAGNLEINSKGEMLVASDCFKRNASEKKINRKWLENKFAQWFGCTQLDWIDNVTLTGDDTEGHIDNLVRFCEDELLVYASVGHPSDPNNAALESLAEQLNKIKKNRTLELVPLPMPSPIHKNNIQLPASYANFLISNECVFVPVFQDNHDQQALKLLEDCFPTREIIAIESTALIQQFGGIHCATKQIPYGV